MSFVAKPKYYSHLEKIIRFNNRLEKINRFIKFVNRLESIANTNNMLTDIIVRRIEKFIVPLNLKIIP
ncbi:hypothetical protein BpHYR1_031139 [Brachionus plicatilis]|uniref:Transposase n=1 Tax=Brachionus plicatilis TaxID=10195 RepID=A0A3M7SJN3_BRAPC|nr:hypothetical protein BpHYR1_031139 [Brachionus plicatilis]